MKILSIIGTRPQYIKIKPFYNYCKRNRIEHKIVDTLQHYSDQVSKNIIEDLDLKIDYKLQLEKNEEISFISETIVKLQRVLEKEKPDIILVFGDTNSSFCAALTAYKMDIPIGHIEAGLRCGDFKVPEEINRTFVDSVSTWKFCSSPAALENIKNGIYCGDLEYELLKNIDPPIARGDYGVMTIHRQANCNVQRLMKILNFCKKIEKKIFFPVHHRIKNIISELKVPKNVHIMESVCYNRMVELMSDSSFILTDSGGIQKTSAFFGKPTVIFRKNIEWVETEQLGFTKRFDLYDEEFLLGWIKKARLTPMKELYMNSGSPSKIIYETIRGSGSEGAFKE